MSDIYKQHENQIILATFLAPVLGGAILYYGLRKHNEPIAKKANNLSWLAFLGWIGISVVLGTTGIEPDILRYSGLVIGLVGITVAITTLGKVKRATSAEQTAEFSSSSQG